MLHRIVEVQAKSEYRLWIRFEDGAEGVVDLSALVGKGVFRTWEDAAQFRRVFIDTEAGTVAWPGGIDLAPDALYREVAGVST